MQDLLATVNHWYNIGRTPFDVMSTLCSRLGALYGGLYGDLAEADDKTMHWHRVGQTQFALIFSSRLGD